MTIDEVEIAIKETDRFRAAAFAYRALVKTSGYIFRSKESAAVKRASMDLSNVLVALRRPIS